MTVGVSADEAAEPVEHGQPATSRVHEFTPLQRRTLDMIRKDRPVVFAEAFVERLRTEFGEALHGFHDRLGDAELFVNKHRLSTVFGCEVQHLLDEQFTWSPAVAGGMVAHRAVELRLNRRVEAAPGELVDEAYEQLADDARGVGPYLAGLPEADRALLRSAAVEKVINFEECFPPLPTATKVRTEASIRWPLEGPILLSGKVDVVIGANARGRESQKVLIDLKTGWVAPRHREDLRFYALVETLRAGVPPRKLATFYLDAGDANAEDVTEGVLQSAARRTLDGVNREIELRIEGATPVKRPGAPCRWCPLAPDCDEGTTYLTARDDAPPA